MAPSTENGKDGMGSSATKSPFIYLLNAFEAATHDDAPADVGYAEKRQAVLDYVAKLEAAVRSETATSEGYPGIAHDLETMRAAMQRIVAYAESDKSEAYKVGAMAETARIVLGVSK